MKNFLNRGAVALCTALTSVAAFAEDALTGTGISADLVTPYITEGKTAIIAVLTAGAVIVGAFYIWGLIKRAVYRSK